MDFFHIAPDTKFQMLWKQIIKLLEVEVLYIFLPSYDFVK